MTLTVQTLGVVPGSDQQLGDAVWAGTVDIHQGWGMLLEQSCDLPREVIGLLVEELIPPGQQPQGHHRGLGRSNGFCGRPSRGQGINQLCGGQASIFFPERIWTGDQHGLDLVDGGGPVTDCRGPCGAQDPQGLHQAIIAFRDGFRSSRQDCLRSRVGIELIGLALAASVESVRPVDLDDAVACGGEFPGDSCAVAAGAFDADLVDERVPGNRVECLSVPI